MISFKEYVAQQMNKKKIEMTESLRHAVLHGNKPKSVAEPIREMEVIAETVPVKKVTVRQLLQRTTLKKLKNVS